MTPEEMAGRLDGCEYRAEVTAELRDLARENGLVIVYGASDDLIEFRGARDEREARRALVVEVKTIR